MRRILLIVTATVFICSCQKKVDWQYDPSTGEILSDTVTNTIDSSGLLSRIVAITKNETITTSFLYDNSHQLIGEHTLGTTSGVMVDITKTYHRDTLGRIMEVVVTKRGAGVNESNKTKVVYDEDSKDFLGTIGTINLAGAIVADSTVFTYDGNSHIAVAKHFQKLAISNADRVLKAWEEFSYVDNNLVSIKNYRDTITGGDLVLTETKLLTYDKRINPLPLSKEAFLTGRIEAASQNNLTGIQKGSTPGSTNISVMQSRFVYGGSRKPLSAITTSLPSGTITQVAFFY